VLRAAQEKYRIVYLSTDADQPLAYLKLRAAIKREWVSKEEEQFPVGPVLARAAYPEAADAQAFYSAAIADLKRCFQGDTVGVTGRVEEARVFRAAGLRTFLAGERAEEVPEGVTSVPSWMELGKHLR
jgi:hypothetical protein